MLHCTFTFFSTVAFIRFAHLEDETVPVCHWENLYDSSLWVMKMSLMKNDFNAMSKPNLDLLPKTLIICTATRVYITGTKSIRLSDDNQYSWSKTEQELTWKAKPPNPPPKNAVHTFFCTQCRMTAVIWYLSYQRTREVRFMSVCVHARACVFISVHKGCSSY